MSVRNKSQADHGNTAGEAMGCIKYDCPARRVLRMRLEIQLGTKLQCTWVARGGHLAGSATSRLGHGLSGIRYRNARVEPGELRVIEDVECLGAKLEVPTLKGTEEMEIPAGTQHGEVFKLKGKGLPDVRSHRMGDELVQVLVEIPKKLTEKQKQLLREFAGTEDQSAMPQRKGFLDKLKDVFNG